MYPQSFRPSFKALTLLVAASLTALPGLQAQQDAPAIDVGQLLQALRAIRDQQTAQLKTQKQNALQQINAVAGSPERAMQFWEEAVRATQFDGMAKEGAQFRAWKENEGELLKEKEVQTAVHLHLTWLALTLQRSAGVKIKDLLPSVVNYTKELSTDEAVMDALSDNMKHEKEAAAIAPAGGGNRRPQTGAKKASDGAIKKAHDQILRGALTGSPVVKWLNLGDAIHVDKWETNPSNFDGIFTNIILPELRDQKDVRVLEYWDIKLKKEADNASRSKLAYEIEKFNTQRRPALLWNRSQEYVNLGQKNRAVSEMFALIKTYPTHPDADDWIGKLEQMLLPPAPAAPTTPSPGAAATPSVPGL
jgi:hypothetical protein